MRERELKRVVPPEAGMLNGRGGVVWMLGTLPFAVSMPVLASTLYCWIVLVPRSVA